MGIGPRWSLIVCCALEWVSPADGVAHRTSHAIEKSVEIASELSKRSGNAGREAAEESSGQPAMIVDDDANSVLVRIWKHSNHIALARGDANEGNDDLSASRLGPRGDDGCEVARLHK
jgi:hypothetical protein